MTPAISFAIPFYRDTDLLRIAVESVLAQSRDDWRLIVCDDSGLDLGVGPLLREYDDERISYTRNATNLGMVATWNRCLDGSGTDLVTLLHADDALLPRYAETMLALAQRHPEASALYCRAEIIDRSGQPAFSLADRVKGFLEPRGRENETLLQGEDAVASLMAGYFIMTPTLCYRKSHLGARRFDPAFRQVQDLMFIVDLLLDGHTIVGTKTCAYAYRRHDESATSLQSASMLRFDEEVEAFDRIATRAEALGWNRAAAVARRKRIIELHLLYRSLREFARLRFQAAFAALRYRRGLRNRRGLR